MAQALQHASSALRLDPGHEPAAQLRKRVKDVENLKEQGNVAFKMGKLEEALDKYDEALLVSGLLSVILPSLRSVQRVGENAEEGNGGQIRATLLSNKATTLLKVTQNS